jgi:hypothetical protein
MPTLSRLFDECHGNESISMPGAKKWRTVQPELQRTGPSSSPQSEVM